MDEHIKNYKMYPQTYLAIRTDTYLAMRHARIYICSLYVDYACALHFNNASGWFFRHVFNILPATLSATVLDAKYEKKMTLKENEKF